MSHPGNARPPSVLDSDPAATDDVRAVLRAIEAFGRAQRCIGGAFAHELDLPRATLGVLFKLHAHGVMQISELAHQLQVDVSVASRQVTALVDEGLAVRDIDPDDRRARTVALSPTGLARATEARRSVGRHLAGALSDWDSARLTALATSLNHLTDAVTTHFGAPAHHSKDHA
ncbi:MarR family winged helix-turn-helix transcriptional regulator [Sanguibacter sp. A247]|uniref:MarR family winged helix-turn-helix transcriptional regulator n=1 Tax=unclassified Sanguibacter TaxID=2645534 RepID=UPI003FD8578B